MQNILFVTAHPDDIAYGMGGGAMLLKQHFNLHVVCATRGEKGIRGVSETDTAIIREQEELACCKLINAELRFLDRTDRELFADRETATALAKIILELQPVAVFTLWPLDSHPDHSAVSELTVKALFLADFKCELLYCEEGLGIQTTHFTPDIYLNISDVIDDKADMLRCYKSQHVLDPALKQSAFRGIEAGVKYAEGYKRARRQVDNFRHDSILNKEIFNVINNDSHGVH